MRIKVFLLSLSLNNNTMWLTVYEACNERINGCKELGANKSSSDKGRVMDGVGDTYDAQAERS